MLIKKKMGPFVSLFFVLFSKSSIAQNGHVFSFAANKHAITIPFDLSNNHIYINVKINKSDTLCFLFDNGAAASGIMIDSMVAARIGLKETGKVNATMTGGTNSFSITDSVSLSIGHLFVAKQKLAWFQLKAQEKEEGHKIDGILSYSFFKYFVFDIDYKNRSMTITDPKYFKDKKLKGRMHMVDLDQNRVPVVKGIVTSIGRKAIKTEFIFDTGHDEFVVLGKALIKKNGLENDTLKVQTTRVNTGLGGETNNKLGRINSFAFGPVRISNPETLFSFDEEGFYSTYNGVLLGGRFFRNYRLILNYPKKYAVLTSPDKKQF
jgi:hypothetical protein